MVMRATVTSANRILPSRTTATAECSSWLWPAKRAQLLGGLRAAGRLAEQPLPQRQRLVGADDIIARLLRMTPQRAFSRASSAAISPGAERPECLLHRALVDIGRNRLEVDAGIGQQRLPRAALRGQDQRMFSAPRASFRKPLPLPVGKQFHDRRRGFLDRAPRDIEQRPIEFGAQLSRKRDFIGHGLAIDIGVVVRGRPCSTAGSAGPGSAAPASRAG